MSRFFYFLVSLLLLNQHALAQGALCYNAQRDISYFCPGSGNGDSFGTGWGGENFGGSVQIDGVFDDYSARMFGEMLESLFTGETRTARRLRENFERDYAVARAWADAQIKLHKDVMQHSKMRFEEVAAMQSVGELSQSESKIFDDYVSRDRAQEQLNSWIGRYDNIGQPWHFFEFQSRVADDAYTKLRTSVVEALEARTRLETILGLGSPNPQQTLSYAANQVALHYIRVADAMFATGQSQIAEDYLTAAGKIVDASIEVAPLTKVEIADWGSYELVDSGLAAAPQSWVNGRRYKVAGAHITPKLAALADDIFKEVTEAGVQGFTIVSGLRTPQRQASALFTKFELGGKDEVNIYSQQDLATEVWDAYYAARTGAAAGEPYSQKAISDMTDVLEEQVRNGRYLSKHMRENALDIRVLDLTPDEVSRIIRVLEEMGISYTVEENPPHIHLSDTREEFVDDLLQPVETPLDVILPFRSPMDVGSSIEVLQNFAAVETTCDSILVDGEDHLRFHVLSPFGSQIGLYYSGGHRIVFFDQLENTRLAADRPVRVDVHRNFVERRSVGGPPLFIVLGNTLGFEGEEIYQYCVVN